MAVQTTINQTTRREQPPVTCLGPFLWRERYHIRGHYGVPHVAFGSKAVLTAPKRDFRSPPNSGHQPTGPVGARSRHAKQGARRPFNVRSGWSEVLELTRGRPIRVRSSRNENIGDTLQDRFAFLIAQVNLVAKDAPIGF